MDVSYDRYQEICDKDHDIADTLSLNQKIHDGIWDVGLWIGTEPIYFVHTNGLRRRVEDNTKRRNRGPIG